MSGEYIAYIGLGANQGDSEYMARMLARAARDISALYGCRLLKQSQVYLTEPQDYSRQPWFANSVLEVAVAASWSPQYFLDALLAIERRLGRTRSQCRLGPRAIDVDLLLFGSVELQEPQCALPHPRMQRRAFVLWPLREIAPGVRIHGRLAEDWLASLCFRVEGQRIFQAGESRI